MAHATAIIGLGTWCGYASAFAQSSRQGRVTWIASFVVVAGAGALAARGRRGKRLGVRPASAAEPWPRSDRASSRALLAGLAPWLVLGVVAAAWDVLGLDTGPREPHLTLSALSQTYRPMHAAVLAVWILIGLGYGVARARRPANARRWIVQPSPAGRGRFAHEDGGTGETGGSGETGASGETANLIVGGAVALAHGGARTAGSATSGHRSPTVLVALVGLLEGSNRGVGVVFWVGIVVAGVVVDLMARRSAGRIATAGDVVRWLSRSVIAQVMMLSAWGFAGWHLFSH